MLPAAEKTSYKPTPAEESITNSTKSETKEEKPYEEKIEEVASEHSLESEEVSLFKETKHNDINLLKDKQKCPIKRNKNKERFKKNFIRLFKNENPRLLSDKNSEMELPLNSLEGGNINKEAEVIQGNNAIARKYFPDNFETNITEAFINHNELVYPTLNENSYEIILNDDNQRFFDIKNFKWDNFPKYKQREAKKALMVKHQGRGVNFC